MLNETNTNLENAPISDNVNDAVAQPEDPSMQNTAVDPSISSAEEFVDAKDITIPSEIEFPRKRYQARVIDATLGKSSKGSTMVTLSCEIVGQDGNEFALSQEGVKIPVIGKEFKLYLLYTLPHGTSKGSIGYVVGFNKKLGINMPRLNIRNPEYEVYKGQMFDILLASEPMILREAPAIGERVGKAILDANGKEIITGHKISADLRNVIGPASFAPVSTEVLV